MLAGYESTSLLEALILHGRSCPKALRMLAGCSHHFAHDDVALLLPLRVVSMMYVHVPVPYSVGFSVPVALAV